MRHAMVISKLDKTLERMQIRFFCLDLCTAISQLLAGIEILICVEVCEAPQRLKAKLRRTFRDKHRYQGYLRRYPPAKPQAEDFEKQAMLEPNELLHAHALRQDRERKQFAY